MVANQFNGSTLITIVYNLVIVDIPPTLTILLNLDLIYVICAFLSHICYQHVQAQNLHLSIQDRHTLFFSVARRKMLNVLVFEEQTLTADTLEG